MSTGCAMICLRSRRRRLNLNSGHSGRKPDEMRVFRPNLYSIGAGALVTNCDDLQKWYECLKNRKILSDTQYYFDEDICIIVISNTESLDQYHFGNGIAAILHNKQASVSYRPEEIFLPPEELEKYTGTYLPGKIHIEQKNGKLYLVRVNQNIHIELYCVGKDSFKRRCEEQQTIHKLISEGDTKPSVWGYELISKQFV